MLGWAHYWRGSPLGARRLGAVAVAAFEVGGGGVAEAAARRACARSVMERTAAAPHRLGRLRVEQGLDVGDETPRARPARRARRPGRRRRRQHGAAAPAAGVRDVGGGGGPPACLRPAAPLARRPVTRGALAQGRPRGPPVGVVTRPGSRSSSTASPSPAASSSSTAPTRRAPTELSERSERHHRAAAGSWPRARGGPRRPPRPRPPRRRPREGAAVCPRR